VNLAQYLEDSARNHPHKIAVRYEEQQLTLQEFDIDLIHFGIMMIVNVEFGFLTFPFGLNLFVSMGITGKTLTDVAKAVMPFLFLLLICLLIITYVPSISLVLPNWLMP